MKIKSNQQSAGAATGSLLTAIRGASHQDSTTYSTTTINIDAQLKVQEIGSYSSNIYGTASNYLKRDASNISELANIFAQIDDGFVNTFK